MMENTSAQYKKAWLVNATIARELACFSPGDRLPTIQEMTERLHSSRGIVQNALNDLQDKGGIQLEKKGKMGTFISSLRRDVLFREGGLDYINGTMPSPLTPEFISLASGICESMEACPVPFTFAFIQSAGRRAHALTRLLIDFGITSLVSAQILIKKYPCLTIMATLDNCIYAPPFVLLSRKRNGHSIASGDRIGADPGAIDQYQLTKDLCKGKKVILIERPYITCRAMFLAGDIDFLVYRREHWIKEANIRVLPIAGGDDPKLLLPAILINKDNYNIGNIIKPYLFPDSICKVQTAVMENRREPIIY